MSQSHQIPRGDLEKQEPQNQKEYVSKDQNTAQNQVKNEAEIQRSNHKEASLPFDVVESPYKETFNKTPQQPANRRKALNIHIGGIDDNKSTFSGISKASKFTNNLLNKSNNGVNDQWYQFIYNDQNNLNDSLNESEGKKSDVSRFTLQSKLSNAKKSNFSRLSQM